MGKLSNLLRATEEHTKSIPLARVVRCRAGFNTFKYHYQATSNQEMVSHNSYSYQKYSRIADTIS